jgi:high-affinity nickel-transport protein
LALTGPFWDFLNHLDFQTLGYAIVAAFVLVWAASAAIWKLGRVEQRWGGLAADQSTLP